MAFILPIITNCLSASTIHAKNSRNSEKGGLVMMMSASSRSFFYLLAFEITIAFQIMPFQVIHIYSAISLFIVCQCKDFPFCLRFLIVVLRIVDFEQRWLVRGFIFFAFLSVTGTDELFQPKPFKVLSKKLGEIAPLGVIAGKQYRFTPKHIGIVF